MYAYIRKKRWLQLPVVWERTGRWKGGFSHACLYRCFKPVCVCVCSILSPLLFKKSVNETRALEMSPVAGHQSLAATS